MNPTYIRQIAKQSVRYNQVLNAASHMNPVHETVHAHGMTPKAWFGVMGGVAIFFGGFIGFLDWCYTDSKMEGIFKNQRALGGSHSK
ncbi:hypothetical protein ACO0QE_001995 [Hanseniaspora vineae]